LQSAVEALFTNHQQRGVITTAIAARISNISPIDRLGDIKAEIARLKEIEAHLLDEVKALGAGAHDGGQYRANVIVTEDRQSLCPKAAEAKLRDLGVDGRWFSKNQKTTKGSTSVRIVARKS
jgi:hypothetical protein